MVWNLAPRGVNLVTLSRPITVKRAKTIHLTHEDIGLLLDAFRGHRYEGVFIVAIGLGLRIGEALALRWADVALEPGAQGGVVTVRCQLQRVDGRLQLTEPKSATSERTLYLPGFVTDALGRRQAQQEQEQALGGAQWANPLGLVFTNRHGGPLDYSRVAKRFRELLDRGDETEEIRRRIGERLPNAAPPRAGEANAGEKKKRRGLRLHDLRHIAASVLLGEGVPAKVTSEMLGHSDIRLTLNTYSHVMPHLRQEAAAAMDRAVEGRSRGKREP